MREYAFPGGALLLAAFLGFAGCSAPGDETWVQITGIARTAADTSDTPNSTNLDFTSVVESDLRNGRTDLVDVEVQNATVILGSSGGGVSVTVYHARVEYFVTSHSLPSFHYPVTLFLPAPVAGEAGAAATKGVLNDLPLVPSSFKGWILNPDTFPADIAARGFTAEARITLRARTEEGRELETAASVTVIFK